MAAKNEVFEIKVYDKEKKVRINFDSTKIINEFDDLGRVKIGLAFVVSVLPLELLRSYQDWVSAICNL